jgi:hypothetical protein
VTSNPLAAELKAATARVRKTRKHHLQLVDEMTWHQDFDPSAAGSRIERHRRELDRLETEQRRVAGEWAAAVDSLNDLRRRAAPTWSPTSWFSTKRLQVIYDRRDKQREADEIAARGADLDTDIDSTRKQLEDCERELARYEQFQPDAATERLAALAAELQHLEHDRDTIARRKHALDASLKEPERVLSDLRGELAEIEAEQEHLLRQIDGYESDIALAERYAKKLNNAENSYERRTIHQECAGRLGNGSPGAVTHDRRRQIRELNRTRAPLERRLEGARRAVEKAEARVQDVTKRGLRDIRALVIDASNVCYRESEFIGLAALLPLCATLMERFQVTVVFDASTRHRLGMSEADLRVALPKATVHVAPARTQADETILEISNDLHTYVVSRDRFAEYADKPAVRERRLIPHQIVGDNIMVRDLEVTVSF